jgi:hypothetical protein
MRFPAIKLLLILLLLNVGRQTTFGQPLEKIISSKDYYTFFNSLINLDSVKEFNLASNPDLRQIIQDTGVIFRDSSLFTSSDVQFMKLQIQEKRNFRWESNKILGAHVIRSKKLQKLFKKGPEKGWKEFNKRYKGGFATFSFPLFSIDKKSCIVYRSGHCGGLCGHGGTSLYKKIDGKWTFVTLVGTIWIS